MHAAKTNTYGYFPSNSLFLNPSTHTSREADEHADDWLTE